MRKIKWGEDGELRWDGGEMDCKGRRKVCSRDAAGPSSVTREDVCSVAVTSVTVTELGKR